MRKNKLPSLAITILLAFSIPFLTIYANTAKQYLFKARASAANLTIHAAKIIGPVPSSWRSFAQGGEEFTPYTLTPVVSEMALLSPKYIRIDHLYDFYEVVSKNEDSFLNYNFEKLDIVVSDILKTGAKPFFAISYMPPVLSRDGIVTSLPNNWIDWQELVRSTIEHYSGREGMNLEGVYYEIWNEPDLFGRWEIGRGEKDYLLLYTYSARGALGAQNTNKFFFGGPATTGAYPNWFRTLIDYTNRSNLPLDFISWHYYGADINKFSRDIDNIDQILREYPSRSMQKIVTEWGIDSENNPAYDNLLSATHTLATLKAVGGRLDQAFIFEIKDGIDPAGSPSGLWGRWGILGHETSGKIEKPRYKALQMLNSLSGNLIEVTGGGTYVDAFATRNNDTLNILLYNFDLTGSNYESVPLTLSNLEQGNYRITWYSLVSKTPQTIEVEVTDGSLSYSIITTPNDIAYITVQKLSDLANFTQGRIDSPLDQSLELTPQFKPPVYDLNIEKGNISFWFKPYWSGSDDILDYHLFTLIGAGGQTITAKAEKIGFTPSLVFSLFIGGNLQQDSQISIPIGSWTINSWHQLSFDFTADRIRMEIDPDLIGAGAQNIEKQINIVLLPINSIELGQANGAVDDLEVKIGEEVIFSKRFDGNLD